MLNGELLERRREELAGSDDLQALLARLTERAAPLLERMPAIPTQKALLSADGGVCPVDGAALVFDPWSPSAHRCPRCAAVYTGGRHDRAWARFQHLWLAERAAHLAAVGVFGGNAAAMSRAREILASYGERYLTFPNRDNVLGPSRLFFSTYLESIWITSYLAAAVMLRSAGELDDDTAALVGGVADEAANLIGEFDEGMSNRQAWNATALLAIAVWFQDDELAAQAIQGQHGLVTLTRGFGGDGMWAEGENYHLFALQGLLAGVGWARAADVDLLAVPGLAERLHAALLAPCVTALPDFTFPARKDSRFGVSLAQPMYLEIWENGVGMLTRADVDPEPLDAWLAALYASAAPPARDFDSCLDEAGEPTPTERGRADLSWRALLGMPPSAPAPHTPWSPATALFPEQGLAVLREGGRYASLECGPHGGGHGHPDRLHLTLHAHGVHWLPDMGTGSYVSRDLFWYRSTLAHNAPMLDGRSQPLEDATCEAFDESGGWSMVRGRFGPVRRTLVAGPSYLIDLVELEDGAPHTLTLPWHLAGDVSVQGAGDWAPVDFGTEFVRDAARSPATGGARVLRAEAGGARIALHMIYDGELLRATGPGAPDSGADATFYLQRTEGKTARIVTVIDCSPNADRIREVLLAGDTIDVVTADGTESHEAHRDGWTIGGSAAAVRLAGTLPVPFRFDFGDTLARDIVSGAALHLPEPPPLDGTLAGFDATEPMTLDYEDQYRRSEEPYGGPDLFSASAVAGWDESALYLAISVVKPELSFRSASAEPLRLDNEPDDINSDGVQLYFRDSTGTVCGVVAIPEAGGAVRTRAVPGTAPCSVRGRWSPTADGYRVTLGMQPPEWAPLPETKIGFDLIVNEMYADRSRRAGQLVWSGGGGWVWLRGDRQDPSRFGELELR